MTLDNGNQPFEPTLSEADRADMLVFLENMLGMLPVLGIHAFEQASAVAAAKGNALLTCKGKGVFASGYEATQGFIVKAGSQATSETVPSMQQHVRGMYWGNVRPTSGADQQRRPATRQWQLPLRSRLRLQLAINSGRRRAWT